MQKYNKNTFFKTKRFYDCDPDKASDATYFYI